MIYQSYFYSFQNRTDHVLNPRLNTLGFIPFPFNGFSPPSFAIRAYSYCCRYSGFPPLFSSLQPYVGMIVERLPSTQVPYDLWNTLGYFAAN